MIQNILIGVTAFGVALYWVMFVERQTIRKRNRMPGKFGVAFPSSYWASSPLRSCSRCSAIIWTGGEQLVQPTVKEATKGVRGWFFCLAFVSIGLESRFSDLRKHLHGGKPIVLVHLRANFESAADAWRWLT